MARAFSRAIALRECLYRIFQAQAAVRRPARQDLAALNEALAGVMGHARIEVARPGIRLELGREASSIDRLLWPVVRAAAELLVSPQRARVSANAPRTVQLAVHRPESDAAPALVQHEDVREPGQGPAVL